MPSPNATLGEFAKELAKDQLRVVKVDSDERYMKGAFWLCLICGSAMQATAQQAHANELFEEGWWWIVEIEWV